MLVEDDPPDRISVLSAPVREHVVEADDCNRNVTVTQLQEDQPGQQPRRGDEQTTMAELQA